MEINMNTLIVHRDGMMSAPIDNDIVILNMKGNNYISLNAVGRRIWELTDSPITVADLCITLKKEFDASSEQIAADVLPFLTELEKEGLVRVIE